MPRPFSFHRSETFREADGSARVSGDDLLRSFDDLSRHLDGCANAKLVRLVGKYHDAVEDFLHHTNRRDELVSTHAASIIRSLVRERDQLTNELRATRVRLSSALSGRN